MSSSTQKKSNSAKKTAGKNIEIHCKQCGKDPYECQCDHPYVPAKIDLIIRKMLKNKKKMTNEQKSRLLVGLRKLKEQTIGNIGGETDISADGNMMVSEDEFTANVEPERNVVAKTFDTHSDFDSYVNQRRGLEMTPKEQQSIIGYQKAKPTQQDKFFAKYEKTDSFGNNTTTVIKKLREGNQFCWTAFTKNETAEDEGKPDEEKHDMHEADAPLSPAQSKPSTPQNQPKETPNEPSQDDSEVTVDDSIRITKTITFTTDSDGSQILGDFLQKLDL